MLRRTTQAKTICLPLNPKGVRHNYHKIDNGHVSVYLHLSILPVTKQVAQRATIAHLRANLAFSYCKSLGDDDPQGLANLDPRGMIGRIYVGYH